MKRLLSIFLVFMLLSQLSFALNSYFFLTNTSGQGTVDDPAKALCEKYTEGKSQIYYGQTTLSSETIVAVCAIEKSVDPDMTEIVSMKSRNQILVLKHPNLPYFDGNYFLLTWDNTREAGSKNQYGQVRARMKTGSAGDYTPTIKTLGVFYNTGGVVADYTKFFKMF